MARVSVAFSLILVWLLPPAFLGCATAPPLPPPPPPPILGATLEDTRPFEGEVVELGSCNGDFTRPMRLSGPFPQPTQEALAHRVEGLMIAKCILSTEGVLRRCHLIRTLPYMEAAFLTVLYQQRYSPITCQGKPVNIEYTVNFKVTLPRE